LARSSPGNSATRAREFIIDALANSSGTATWEIIMTTDLIHRICIAARAEKIYRAITTEEGIKSAGGPPT